MIIKMFSTLFLVCLVTITLMSCQKDSLDNSESTAATSPSLPTIMEIMVDEITPATNTLWAAFDPQTDEEWLALENAAITTIEAAKKTAIGGSGPQDAEWAADPAYQAMNQIMLNAAEAYLVAIEAKDTDALFEAGDQLYTPCEACHLQFNPAVIELQDLTNN